MAKKVVKTAQKVAKKAAPAARKTVRERAGWWGDVRPKPTHSVPPPLSTYHKIVYDCFSGTVPTLGTWLVSGPYRVWLVEG